MDNTMGNVEQVSELEDFTDLFGEAWGPVLRPAKLSTDEMPVKSGPLEFMRASFGTMSDIDGLVLRSHPPMAEKDLENTREMRGKIAVVKRGYNTFFEKAQRVADAGACALILINWADRLEEFHRGPDTDPAHVSIPVVCIRQCDAAQLYDGAHVVCVGPGTQIASTPLPTEGCYYVSGAVSERDIETRTSGCGVLSFGRAATSACCASPPYAQDFDSPDLQGLFAGFMQHGDAMHLVEFNDTEQQVEKVLTAGGADYPIPHQDQIQGILNAEYSTLAGFACAVRFFESCMLSWREKTAIQDALFGGKDEFTKIFAMHMNHLEVATRTANALLQIERRNAEAEELIR